MYLSSFSMTEPEDNVYLYFPTWFNVWESKTFYRALKSTAAHAWGFKRFGTHGLGYSREMIRTPSYQDYLTAMEHNSEAALQQLSAKERVSLLKSRTAFIHVDAWGESGTMESTPNSAQTTTTDALPRNLLKKFSVTDFTCKMRGEKQSFVQAMQVAEDYLNWNIFDYVVVSAAFRAVPMLVFSEEDLPYSVCQTIIKKDTRMNISVERVGCFIFSKKESELQLSCGRYSNYLSKPPFLNCLTDESIDVIAFSGLRKPSFQQKIDKSSTTAAKHQIDLVEEYGASGCLTPALSWIYLQQKDLGHGKMRTLVPDNFGGYSWFDTRY